MATAGTYFDNELQDMYAPQLAAARVPDNNDRLTLVSTILFALLYRYLYETDVAVSSLVLQPEEVTGTHCATPPLSSL